MYFWEYSQWVPFYRGYISRSCAGLYSMPLDEHIRIFYKMGMQVAGRDSWFCFPELMITINWMIYHENSPFIWKPSSSKKSNFLRSGEISGLGIASSLRVSCIGWTLPTDFFRILSVLCITAVFACWKLVLLFVLCRVFPDSDNITELLLSTDASSES